MAQKRQPWAADLRQVNHAPFSGWVGDEEGACRVALFFVYFCKKQRHSPGLRALFIGHRLAVANEKGSEVWMVRNYGDLGRIGALGLSWLVAEYSGRSAGSAVSLGGKNL